MRRSVVSEEARPRRSSKGSNSSLRACIVRCSQFSLWQIFCSTVRGLLKNLYEPKMDVILSISFKIWNNGNWDKETYVLRPTSQTSCFCFVWHMFFHCHEMRVHFCCQYLGLYDSIIFKRRLPAEVPWKGQFGQVYTISLSCVVVRWSRVEPKFLLSTCFFFFPFFGLFAFLFCCFSINIYLTNCYLIKCKKQEEKYCVSGAMSIFIYA